MLCYYTAKEKFGAKLLSARHQDTIIIIHFIVWVVTYSVSFDVGDNLVHVLATRDGKHMLLGDA